MDIFATHIDIFRALTAAAITTGASLFNAMIV
jgi:hypothetical protein